MHKLLKQHLNGFRTLPRGAQSVLKSWSQATLLAILTVLASAMLRYMGLVLASLALIHTHPNTFRVRSAVSRRHFGSRFYLLGTAHWYSRQAQLRRLRPLSSPPSTSKRQTLKPKLPKASAAVLHPSKPLEIRQTLPTPITSRAPKKS